MRRLLTLLLGATAAAAAAQLARRRRQDSAAAPAPPSPMPAPTARPLPDPTPGPIDEGAPGAVTAAPVPEAPAPAPQAAPDDATLEQAVETEIAGNPAVDEDGVRVDVDDGVAQLSGTVPDPETAERVGDDAAHVDGVVGIDNQLRPGDRAEE